MALSKEQLYEALVEGGGITREEFMKAAKMRDAKTRGVDVVLISLGLITETQIGQLVADWYNVAHFNIDQKKVQKDALALIPEQFARKKLILPISQTKSSVTIASSNPDDVPLRSLLEKYLRKEVKILYATEREIKGNLYLFQEDPSVAFANIVRSAESGGGENIVVDLVNAFFNYAYQGGASDIHIEPEDEYTVIRFRVDGMLKDIADIPQSLHEPIITRLKVISKLATDEHRAAQDGRISYESDYGESVDIRLSIVPTTNGEKAVMRLLSEKSRQYSLTDLGLSDIDFERFKKGIKSPWGMILVTGPTGSGKTTTLYSALKLLNKREVNIATIEDPVEYDMEGINQIQVNTKTDLTFAKGLRSIVRQDPDIVMVGEIRDTETADIAVNAAMTGHLVLSTLHTNDAATTFPRIRDMGVEDFLISSTAIIIIAQRLVRKICLHCISSVELSNQEKKTIETFPLVKKYLEKIRGKKGFAGMRIFRGSGCKVCHNTGYKGRSGIFEVLDVTDEIRTAIMESKNADSIKEIALGQGMTSMLYDGLEKVLTGITTLEEVLRVTQE